MDGDSLAGGRSLFEVFRTRSWVGLTPVIISIQILLQ